MDNETKVEIVGIETIKPSSPTPDHLRKYNLSFLDQFYHEKFVFPLFFFPGNPNTIHEKANEISTRLKLSLSKTLTGFYPCAGRLKDRTSIECNDDGIPFVETRVNSSLSGILKQPDVVFLEKLLPSDENTKEAIPGRPLLQVQVNFFECGGIAIGFKFSHMLADGSAFGLFFKAWSSTTLNPDDATVISDFNLASFLPAIDISEPNNASESLEGQCFARRYVFDASKIALLKAKAVREGVTKPSRVECVNALIWKCMAAISTSKSGFTRPSIFTQSVDLRKRVEPPLPENSFGNIFLLSVAGTEGTKSEFHDLIQSMRRGIQDTIKIVANGFHVKEIFHLFSSEVQKLARIVCEEGRDKYMITSWCKFPFYEIDFGWGKPIWITPTLKLKNNFFLTIDARDGEGIELWCYLLPEDVSSLEQDQEFLAYASINPSVPIE